MSTIITTTLELEARIYGTMNGTRGVYVAVHWTNKNSGEQNFITIRFPDNATSKRLQIKEEKFMVHYDRATRSVKIQLYPEGYIKKGYDVPVKVKEMPVIHRAN